MKKTTYFIRKKLLLFGLLVFPLIGFAQHFTVTLDNVLTTTNTMELDVMLIVDGTTTGVRLASCSTGINYNTAILDGGEPSIVSSNSGGDSWILVPGTIAPELTANGGLNPIVTTNRGNGLGHLRIVQTTMATSQVDILPGTYRIGTFRFTNTVPWAVDADPELWLSPTKSIPHAGSTNTIVSFAPYGVSTAPLAATTITSPYDVTLGYTQGAPLHRVLNSSLATVSNESVSKIATAFPNPFQDAFKLNINAVSSEGIQVQVYDMLGKRIEDFNVAANQISDFEIGKSYPSGFYNLKVTQGEKSQSIRMIKQ